jgi:hypothetical protein
MAQSRVQVGRLNAPTQSDLRPQAAPVETYVRPVESQVQASPLSQFMSAISPAIEADAQIRKADRLKRERELETNKTRRQLNQLQQAGKILEANMDAEYYTTNEAGKLVFKPEYLDMDTADVLALREKSVDEYTKQLEGVIDPMYIEGFKEDQLAVSMIWGNTTYRTAKEAHNKGKLNNALTTTLTAINDQAARDIANGVPNAMENAALQVNAQINNHYAANSDLYSSFEELNNVVRNFAFDEIKYRADTPTVAWLDDAKLSKNQLGVGKYAARNSAILAARETERKTTYNATAKATSINKQVTDAVNTGNASSITKKYTKIDGTEGTYTDAELDAAIFANEDFKALGGPNGELTGQQSRLFGKWGYVPKVFKNRVTDILPLFNAGQDVSSSESNEKLMLGFQTYQMIRNSGAVVESVLDINEDDIERFDALEYLVQEQARVGEVSQEGKTVQNYSNAVAMVQRMDFTIPRPTKLTEDVAASMDASWYADAFGTDLSESYNSAHIMAEAADRVHHLVQLGQVSYKDALKQVAAQMARDYPITKSSDGTAYAYKQLNTGIDESLNASDVIADYNAALANSDKLAKYMADTHRLKKGEYVVALQPNTVNPKATSIHVWDTREDTPLYLGVAGGQIDRITLLNDKQQLYNLEATVMTQDNEFTTGYTSTVPDALLSDSQQVIEDTINQNLTYFGGTGEAGQAGTFEDLLNSPAAKDLDKLINPNYGILTRGITHGFNLVPTAEGLAKEAEYVKSLFKGTGQVRETVTPEDAAARREDLGLSIGDVTPMNAFTDMFKDATPEVKEVVDKLSSNLNFVTTANATATIMNDEGFEYTPYDDMGKQSVGHGLQIESLEDDEKALIADINNVQPEESAAVVALKVDKITNYFSDAVEGFENLPETAKSGMIQMGYQLGRFNVTKEWPKFMESIKEAAQYAEGSAEQATALAKAKFNMLYNVAEDGTATATRWATQTKNRAIKVANELASSAGDAAASIFEAVIPKAHADTDLIPQKEQLKVGDVPTASAVVDIALAQNPADAAYKYYGIDENTDEGAAAVKGFFKTSVGDWNPDQETVEEFATNKAWCAAFLTQVLRDSGIDTKALFGTDKFDQIRAKAYTNVGTQVEPTQVKAGDVMVKQHTAEERKKFKLGYGHVGIVVKVEGDEVFFIGGNTGDRVTMSSYNMNEKQVDFRRIQNASDIPTESLPSMLELKAGVYTRKAVKKAKNLFTSMYDNIFG